jgi:peptidoglycan hydrolase CwlO-like protein
MLASEIERQGKKYNNAQTQIDQLNNEILQLLAEIDSLNG